MANTVSASIAGSQPAKALSKDDLHRITLFLAKIFLKYDRIKKKPKQNENPSVPPYSTPEHKHKLHNGNCSMHNKRLTGMSKTMHVSC